MKTTKQFFGEICKDKYPTSNDYVIIEAHTLKEAQEICNETIGDLVGKVYSKKPNPPYNIVCILTGKTVVRE